MKFAYYIFLIFGFVIIYETDAVTWPNSILLRQGNTVYPESGSVVFPNTKRARQAPYQPQNAPTNGNTNPIRPPQAAPPMANTYPNRPPAANLYADCSSTCVSQGINRLAIGLDYTFFKSNPEENLLIAPVNILKTLATLALGSGGTTEKELIRFLNLFFVKRKITDGSREFHEEIGKLITRITDVSPGVRFGSNINIAGGVFVQKGLEVKPKYKELAKEIYRTDIYELDFANDGAQAANAVNRWVADHTNNKIKEIIQPPVDPMTRLIIAGALYFNGDWEYPFFPKATKWQPFHTTGDEEDKSKTIQVQMMVGQANIPYYEDREVGYQAIGLPYKGNVMYMFVVLPRPNTSLKNLTCKFMHNDFSNIIQKSKEAEVFYVMPKMQLENKLNLRPTLENVGQVRTLFNPATANLSNIADGRGLYASEIIHKVQMDVNELGTTASAATATTVNRGGYVNFRADRPFFLFIYNINAKVTTFWARIQKPTPNKPL